MIASLPMYDWPEVRFYTDDFWARLQPELKVLCDATPAQLDRSDLHKQWQSDDLLLSQTCAYPLITSLPESTLVIGTPVYQCEFCAEGLYASPVLIRQSDYRQTLAEFEGSTLAFNGTESQSGFNALKTLLVEQKLIDKQHSRFFSHSVLTGSHRGSIQAVANGTADLCAVDPVCWALAQRFDANTQHLRVLTSTRFSPALPLISNAKVVAGLMQASQWQNAVMQAFEQAINAETTQHLLLSGVRFIPKVQYSALPVSNLDMITPTASR